MIDKLLKTLHLSDLESFKYGSVSRNTILNWESTDTEELYKENFNKKTTRALLEKYNWIDTENDITYEYDDCGFRINSTYDIKSDKRLLVLGCSTTFGVGLKAEQTWPWIIGKKLNYKVFNLAVVGTGLSNMFMKLMYWLPKINPDIVICFAEDYTLNRVDMFKLGDDLVEPYIIDQNETSISVKLQKEFNQYVLDERNVFLSSYKNLIAMKYLTKINECKFISNWDFDLYKMKPPKDFARDLIHDGELYNKFLAARFYRKVR
jgi:hypothetical protein